ncbi:MAG: hypothetical protein M1823_002592 [Watsoniomyces obsoletus]|nr:MAG: hypothetical protein M1823_002592 [Watsoniomyces obsoletus]
MATPNKWDASKSGKSWERIQKTLGFTRQGDLIKWLKSDLYRPYWMKFLDEWLLPERARLRESGKLEGATLQRVLDRIVDGKSNGRARYSRKERYDQID